MTQCLDRVKTKDLQNLNNVENLHLRANKKTNLVLKGNKKANLVLKIKARKENPGRLKTIKVASVLTANGHRISTQLKMWHQPTNNQLGQMTKSNSPQLQLPLLPTNKSHASRLNTQTKRLTNASCSRSTSVLSTLYSLQKSCHHRQWTSPHVVSLILSTRSETSVSSLHKSQCNSTLQTHFPYHQAIP